MRISDWSADVCSSDLVLQQQGGAHRAATVHDGGHRCRELQRRHRETVAVGDRHGVDLAPRRGHQRSADLAQLDRGRLQQAELRSEEHTSELQSLMRISYAVFCLKKKKKRPKTIHDTTEEGSMTKYCSQ